MTTLVISHPACLSHDMGEGHPERPDRLRAVERALESEAFQMLTRDVAPRADVFVVNGLGEQAARQVTLLVMELRENGLRTERAYGDRSVKAQWKLADRSGAAYGVMLGRAEAERDAVAVKDLRSGEQVEVPHEGLLAWLQQRQEDGGSDR